MCIVKILESTGINEICIFRLNIFCEVILASYSSKNQQAFSLGCNSDCFCPLAVVSGYTNISLSLFTNISLNDYISQVAEKRSC